MIIYLTVTALALAQIGVVFTGTRLAIKAASVGTCVVFAGLAGFRGLVGTDTWLYGFLIKSHLRGLEVGLEPGFLYIIDSLQLISMNPDVILRLIAVLFFSLIIVYIWRSSHIELVYLVVFFAPQYYVLYSMNGVRIGLSTAVFLLFYQSWIRRETVRSYALILLAFSIHYSILIPVAILLLGDLSGASRRDHVRRIALASIFAGAAYSLQSLATETLDGYSQGTVTGRSAGLSGVVKLAVLLYIGRYLPVVQQHRRAVAALCGALGFGAALVAQFSYAGLRILDLVVWVTPLMYLRLLPSGASLPRRYLLGLALVGLVGAIAVLRNIYGTDGVGNSPFLPYTTFWSDDLRIGRL